MKVLNLIIGKQGANSNMIESQAPLKIIVPKCNFVKKYGPSYAIIWKIVQHMIQFIMVEEVRMCTHFICVLYSQGRTDFSRYW